jgi:MFS family permease
MTAPDDAGRAPGRPDLLLAVASSLVVMTGAAVAPALQAIGAGLALAPDERAALPIVLTLPALVIGLAGAPVGVALDRVGRRPVLLGGLLLLGAAGTAGLWVDALPALLVSRALVGVSAAAVMTASSTLVADLYVGPARAAALSTQAVTMGLGGIAFPALGGALADLHWRAPFALFLLAGPVLVWAWGLPEPARAAAHASADDRPTPWALLLTLDAAAFVGMALFYVIPVQSSFLVAERLGAPASSAGVAIALCTLPGVVLSANLRRLVAWLGAGGVLALTFTTPALGYAVLAGAHGWPQLAAGLILCGVGFGVLVPNLSLWQAELAAPAVRGRAMALLTLSFFLGQFASPWIARAGLGPAATLEALFSSAALAAPAAGVALGPLIVWLSRRPA